MLQEQVPQHRLPRNFPKAWSWARMANRELPYLSTHSWIILTRFKLPLLYFFRRLGLTNQKSYENYPLCRRRTSIRLPSRCGAAGTFLLDTTPLNNSFLSRNSHANRSKQCQTIHRLVLKIISMLGLCRGFPGIHGEE